MKYFAFLLYDDNDAEQVIVEAENHEEAEDTIIKECNGQLQYTALTSDKEAGLRMIAQPKQSPHIAVWRWQGELKYKLRGRSLMFEDLGEIGPLAQADAESAARVKAETFLKDFDEKDIESWDVKVRPLRRKGS